MDARAKGSESAKTANLRPKSMDGAEPDTSRKLSGGAK